MPRERKVNLEGGGKIREDESLKRGKHCEKKERSENQSGDYRGESVGNGTKRFHDEKGKKSESCCAGGRGTRALVNPMKERNKVGVWREKTEIAYGTKELTKRGRLCKKKTNGLKGRGRCTTCNEEVQGNGKRGTKKRH